MIDNVRAELAEALDESELAGFVADPQDIAAVLLPVVERIAREAVAQALREYDEQRRLP